MVAVSPAGDVGVMRLGAEAQRVAVGIEDLGQDPAEARAVHAGVRLAEFVQVAGEGLDGGPVGQADGEVVEPGGRAGAVRVEVFWNRLAEDGLLPTGSDLAWLIDTASVLAAAETCLLVTRLFGWDLDTYEAWLARTLTRLVPPPDAR